MATRFHEARFHVDFGPASLFDRVRFVMGTPRALRLHAAHLRERAAERNAPLELLSRFDPVRWRLLQATARIDTGKFVSSTWSVATPGGTWWVVVGLGDTILSTYDVLPGRSGRSGETVESGPLYEFVESVNRRLMEEERPAAVRGCGPDRSRSERTSSSARNPDRDSPDG